MRNAMLTAPVLTLLVLLGTSLAEETCWNQFRGPHGDGTSDAKNLPLGFDDESSEVLWKTPVPGRAWASPVVWEDQVWLANAPQIQNPEGATNKQAFTDDAPPLEEPIRLSAVCLDLESGEVVHDVTVLEVFKPQYTHSTNSYASPTPWIEAGRLYVHFGSYGTACIDTETGEKLWENRELECNHWRGAGSSPVVHGDLIFVTFDGYDKQFIAAINKHTGETVWKRDRGIDYGTDNGDRMKAYSTPRVINVEGRDLLISPFAMATIAYEPQTGEAVWTVYHGGMNAAARPLYGNGLVYINAGDGREALIAVDPKGEGDITETNIVWRMGRLTPKRPSQILLGESLFMMNDSGVCSCLDALTGDVIWAERISGAYWASPIYAQGHLYFFSQEGKAVVVKASREFEPVDESTFDEGFTASPAVADNSLILRSESHVYRVAKQD